jgi:glycosyltransferase involved in cell wall biosynthesis
VPDDVLDLAVSAADQVVLPFSEASQSASVIFAMTHGKCVVASAVGEVTRTLRDRGLLVAPDDPEDVSRAMALVEDDPEECRRLAAAARQYAMEDLSWAKVAANTVEVYRND